MKFSKEIQNRLIEVQRDFMPEDTEAGQIQGFLEHYSGNQVCSKQLFKEALGHTFEEPKRWQLHSINEIMNTAVTGWKAFLIHECLQDMVGSVAGNGYLPATNYPTTKMDLWN